MAENKHFWTTWSHRLEVEIIMHTSCPGSQVRIEWIDSGGWQPNVFGSGRGKNDIISQN